MKDSSRRRPSPPDFWAAAKAAGKTTAEPCKIPVWLTSSKSKKCAAAPFASAAAGAENFFRHPSAVARPRPAFAKVGTVIPPAGPAPAKATATVSATHRFATIPTSAGTRDSESPAAKAPSREESGNADVFRGVIGGILPPAKFSAKKRAICANRGENFVKCVLKPKAQAAPTGKERTK